MKQSIKMHVLVLSIIAFCITSCIILAKVYFTCIIGISSFVTTNNAQTIVIDSVATNVQAREKQNLSDVSYVTDIYHRYK